MNIQHPILALLVYFGIGLGAAALGTSMLASITVLVIGVAYFYRGMRNLMSSKQTGRVDWGIFEVDKASLVFLLLAFIFALTQVDSIESVADWILILLGMIFCYKAVAYYFLRN